MQIFNGNEEAKKLEEKIKIAVNELSPSKALLIIQVGDNPVSEKYIQLKVRFCDRLNIPVHYVRISADLDDSKIKTQIMELMLDAHYSSVIVQLPLPRESLNSILEEIPSEKDVDCLANPQSYINRFSPVVRAVDNYIKYALERNLLDIDNPVAIVGQGRLVGLPIKNYLEHNGWKIHMYDKDSNVDTTVFSEKTVILSAGVPRMLTASNFVDATNIIDFGSSIVNEKILGDFDTETHSIENLGLLSLSPGGMGPLVVRYLIMNHLGI